MDKPRESYIINTPPKTAAAPAMTALPVTLGNPPLLDEAEAAALVCEDEAVAVPVCEASTLDAELLFDFDTPVGS